jgi:phage terminase small subunit
MSDNLPCLPPKRRRFADEWLIDENATQAAIRAGFSERCAKQQGSRLLSNADVRAYISAKQEERSRSLGFTADRIKREYLAIALADRTEIFRNVNGAVCLKPFEEWPLACRQAIAGVKVKRRMEGRGDAAVPMEVIEIRFEAKEPALRQLAKCVRLVPTEYQVEGDGTQGPTLTEILRELMRQEKEAKQAKEVTLIQQGTGAGVPPCGTPAVSDGPPAPVEAGGPDDPQAASAGPDAVRSKLDSGAPGQA